MVLESRKICCYCLPVSHWEERRKRNLRLTGRFLENKTDSINDFSVTAHMCVCHSKAIKNSYSFKKNRVLTS